MKKLFISFLMFSTFFSAIARDKWAIEPWTALGLLPHVLNYMEGKQSPFFQKGEEKPEYKPYAIQALEDDYEPQQTVKIEDTQQGSIAVIPMHGVLMKYDGACGEPGALTYSERVNYASYNDNISAILIDCGYGPGGQVSGTATLSDAITKAAKVKPVISLVNDGLAASAHYWAISGSTEIIMSHKHCMIGSVGIYGTLIDFKQAYEKLGVKIEDVYAPQSSEKNKSFREWADKNNKALLEAEFGFVAEEFIENVLENRGTKLTKGSSWSKGKIFYAEDGIKEGLADGIGDFRYALQRAQKLSKKTFTVKLT